MRKASASKAREKAAELLVAKKARRSISMAQFNHPDAAPATES